MPPHASPVLGAELGRGPRNSTRRIQLPGGPAAGLTEPTRPASRVSGSFARLTPVGQKYWTCSRCSTQLSHDAIAQKQADLKDGVLTCKRCLERNEPRKKKTLELRIPLLSALGLAVVLAPFFPGPVLFMVLLLSLAAAAWMACADTLYGWKRPAAVALSLTLAVGSLATLLHLRESKRVADEESELHRDAAEIATLLEKDRYEEAVTRVRMLGVAAMDRLGRYRTKDAKTLLLGATERVDAWVTRTYGALSEDEIVVLNALLVSFPPEETGGARRILSVRIIADKLEVRALVGKADASVEQKATFASSLLTMALESQSKCLSAEVELLSDPEAVGQGSKHSMSRAQLHSPLSREEFNQPPNDGP